MFQENLKKFLKNYQHRNYKESSLEADVKNKTKQNRNWVSSEQWTWMILITNHLTLNSIEILLGKSSLPRNKKFSCLISNQISKMVAKENKNHHPTALLVKWELWVSEFKILCSCSCEPPIQLLSSSSLSWPPSASVSRSWNTSHVGFHSPLPAGPPHSSPTILLAFTAPSSSACPESCDAKTPSIALFLLPLFSSHSPPWLQELLICNNLTSYIAQAEQDTC